MKHNKIFFPFLLLRGTLMTLSLSLTLWTTVSAQQDTVTATPAEAPEAVETETPELISPSVSILMVQMADKGVELRSTLRAKVKGQFYNLYRMRIRYYQVSGTEEKELGFAITDGNGKASLLVSPDKLLPASNGMLQFKAVFAGNKMMDPAEEVTEFRQAQLDLTPVVEDSVYMVQVKLSDLGSGKAIPVADATVGIYVRRLFLPQKLGEITTDENGEGSLEIPAGLPGDVKGNINLLARVDENETFGNLEASSGQAWGVAVSDQLKGQPRALWSSSPPLWMLITFIILMAAVWGHYLVIVYELFRLRKEQPGHATKN